MEQGRTSGTKVTFKLNGTTDGYVIRVLADEGKNKLKDSEVFAYVSSEEVEGISFTPNGNFGTTGQALGSSDVILGEGKFKMANLTFIRSLPIIKPKIEIQQQFASKIEAIERQKDLIKQSIKEVETLFSSRMDYYFN